MRDQMITVLEAIVVPLLLMNSAGIARSIYSSARSLACGATRMGSKACDLVVAKAVTMRAATLARH